MHVFAARLPGQRILQYFLGLAIAPVLDVDLGLLQRIDIVYGGGRPFGCRFCGGVSGHGGCPRRRGSRHRKPRCDGRTVAPAAHRAAPAHHPEREPAEHDGAARAKVERIARCRHDLIHQLGLLLHGRQGCRLDFRLGRRLRFRRGCRGWSWLRRGRGSRYRLRVRNRFGLGRCGRRGRALCLLLCGGHPRALQLHELLHVLDSLLELCDTRIGLGQRLFAGDRFFFQCANPLRAAARLALVRRSAGRLALRQPDDVLRRGRGRLLLHLRRNLAAYRGALFRRNGNGRLGEPLAISVPLCDVGAILLRRLGTRDGIDLVAVRNLQYLAGTHEIEVVLDERFGIRPIECHQHLLK